MNKDSSLEDLREKFEHLLQNRRPSTISEANRRIIADKFAKKSLQELSEIAGELDDSKPL